MARSVLHRRYRLPTEAEWEYACRAGTTTEFHHGPELLCSMARIDSSRHQGCGPCHQNATTVDVGSYQLSPFLLYDMHGNVAEWCLDSLAGYFWTPLVDPFVTGGTQRIFRGGSWAINSMEARSAARRYGNPEVASAELGIRVVLGPIFVP